MTDLFSTKDAAAYLRLSVSTIKKHVHRTGLLVPDQKVGGSLVFTRETLDRFAAQHRPPGRPRKETPDHDASPDPV